MAQPKFRAGLVSAFAVVALTLAAVGIFGLMAFVVSQRTREFGIRIALGARGGDVLSLVLRRALAISGAGVAVGLAGSIGLSRYLETLLFNVQPLDPVAFSSAAVALGMVALTACIFPARRACKTNPAVALRDE